MDRLAAFDPKRGFNPKRRIAPAPLAVGLPERLARMATQVRYGGNPEHKRNPGDFGLVPPAAPRRGKTLCDELGLLRRAEALALLRAGLERGLVDARWTGEGWPQLIWAVTPAGGPVEAQREADGIYHGYPVPEADPFRVEVLERWQAWRG